MTAPATRSRSAKPVAALRATRAPLAARLEQLERDRTEAQRARGAAHAALVAGEGSPDVLATADAQLGAIASAIATLTAQVDPIDAQLAAIAEQDRRAKQRANAIDCASIEAAACNTAVAEIAQCRDAAVDAIVALARARASLNRHQARFADVVFTDLDVHDPLRCDAILTELQRAGVDLAGATTQLSIDARPAICRYVTAHLIEYASRSPVALLVDQAVRSIAFQE